MIKILEVEFRKLFSSKILGVIFAGIFLPVLMSWMLLMDNENLGWRYFLHGSLYLFNIQSLLTFAVFSSFIWAREYEENTMEVTLCYPYPKFYFFISKLLLMHGIVLFTCLMFALANGAMGAIVISEALDNTLILEFVKVVSLCVLMHFLLLPVTFFATIISKQVLAGIGLGILFLALCMMFSYSSFVQYIPFCIPMVLSDNLFGFRQIPLDSYSVPWYILSVLFVVTFLLCILVLQRKWEW